MQLLIKRELHASSQNSEIGYVWAGKFVIRVNYFGPTATRFKKYHLISSLTALSHPAGTSNESNTCEGFKSFWLGFYNGGL